MGILRKAIIAGVGAIVLAGVFGGKSTPKDCSKVTCTSKERTAARDAAEAEEVAKAKSFGMAWHSATVGMGVAGRELGADLRQIGRNMSK